jgi:predicted DNA binding CopG/RHH family protein
MTDTKRKLRPIPRFASEDAERAFWRKRDSTAYIDWAASEIALFPELKPSTQAISLRLPTALLHELKFLANRQDLPYQSLLKAFLSERIDAEFRGRIAYPHRTGTARRVSEPRVSYGTKRHSRVRATSSSPKRKLRLKGK